MTDNLQMGEDLRGPLPRPSRKRRAGAPVPPTRTTIIETAIPVLLAAFGLYCLALAWGVV